MLEKRIGRSIGVDARGSAGNVRGNIAVNACECAGEET